MTETPESHTGQCFCGDVNYQAAGPMTDVLHCHCENCRRITGNFVAAARSPTAELVIDDPDEQFRWLDLDYARYGFCQGCGSTLFFRATDTPESTSVMIGTLDDASATKLHSVWFAGEAQPHNRLDDSVPHFSGNDVK